MRREKKNKVVTSHVRWTLQGFKYENTRTKYRVEIGFPFLYSILSIAISAIYYFSYGRLNEAAFNSNFQRSLRSPIGWPSETFCSAPSRKGLLALSISPREPLKRQEFMKYFAVLNLDPRDLSQTPFFPPVLFLVSLGLCLILARWHFSPLEFRLSYLCFPLCSPELPPQFQLWLRYHYQLRMNPSRSPLAPARTRLRRRFRQCLYF